MTTKTSKRLIALLLTILTVASLCVPVSAATSGTTQTATITVNTGCNWWRPGCESITLKQDKGTYSYQVLSWWQWKTKTESMYATYRISVYNCSTGKAVNYEWKSGSIKLKFSSNTTYLVTVSYDSTSTWLRSNCHLSSWDKKPYWRVSATNKINSYY